MNNYLNIMNYTILIFLPVTDWHSKIITQFIAWGWTVSGGGNGSYFVDNGTLSSSLAFGVNLKEKESTRDVCNKITDFLNKDEISFFGVVVESQGFMSWQSSTTVLKKKEDTVYRG